MNVRTGFTEVGTSLMIITIFVFRDTILFTTNPTRKWRVIGKRGTIQPRTGKNAQARDEDIALRILFRWRPRRAFRVLPCLFPRLSSRGKGHNSVLALNEYSGMSSVDISIDCRHALRSSTGG